jgi:hypothetical protein
MAITAVAPPMQGPNNPSIANPNVPLEQDPNAALLAKSLAAGPTKVGDQTIGAPAVVSSGNAQTAANGLTNTVANTTSNLSAQANQPYDASTGKTWDPTSGSYSGPVSPLYQGNGSTPTPNAPPATPTGVTAIKQQDGSFTYTAADPNDANAVAQAGLLNTHATLISQIQAPLQTISQIQNGTYVLNAGEQAQLDSIKQMIQQQVDTQNKINNYELASQTQIGANAGGRYGGASVIAAHVDLMNTEAAKITDIQNKGAALLAQTEQAIKDKDFTQANDAFNAYQAAAKEQTDSITTMLKISTDAQTALNNQLKDQIAQQNADTANYKAQITFNKDNGITSQFYSYPGSSQVFDATTGKPVTQQEYLAAGGKPDFSSIQTINTAAGAQSADGKAYQDYLNTLPAGQKAVSFQEFLPILHPKSTSVTYNQAATDNQRQSSADVLSKWQQYKVIQGNGTVSSKDYKVAKQQWISNKVGTAAEFDAEFSGYIDQSGSNWKQDYGVSSLSPSSPSTP